MSSLFKVCAWLGCRRLTRGRHCPAHRLAYRARRQARAIEWIYDSRRWRTETRPAVLERDRACVFCGSTLGLQVAHKARTQDLLAAGLDVFDPELCVATCNAHNAAAAKLATVDELAARQRGGGPTVAAALSSARASLPRETSTTVLG